MIPRPEKLTLAAERREEIFQTYLLTGSKAATARRCAVSEPTVHRVLQDYPPEAIARGRQEAMAEIAARVNEKVLLAIDQLGAEDFARGANGKGPSLMQKTTALAILVDKRVLLEKAMHEYETLQAEARAGTRPLPADVPAMVGAIQGMLKTIGVATEAPAPPPPTPEVPTVPDYEPAPARQLTLEDLDL